MKLSLSFTHLSQPVQGMIYMTIASFWFAAMSAIIRHLSTGTHDIHPYMMVFCRNVFALIGMMPWLMRSGLGILRSGKLHLHFTRSLTGVSAMLLWFKALTVFPLPEAVALSFTVPLFTVIAAIIFLKERMGIHRWSALIIGFLGTLIVLRPGTSTFDPAALTILATACIWATSNILIKKMSKTETPHLIVFYMLVFMTPISLPFAWPHLQVPTMSELAWLIIMALMSNLGQISASTAISKCDMSVLSPFDFARLIFVSIFAYFAFGEVVDMYTIIGALIITASAVYIAHREARLHKKISRPATTAL